MLRCGSHLSLSLSLGMSLSLTKFEYSNIVEFSLVTQTRTPEIDLLNESFDMV